MCLLGTWMRWEAVSKVIGLFVYVFCSPGKHDGISSITVPNYWLHTRVIMALLGWKVLFSLFSSFNLNTYSFSLFFKFVILCIFEEKSLLLVCYILGVLSVMTSLKCFYLSWLVFYSHCQPNTLRYGKPLCKHISHVPAIRRAVQGSSQNRSLTQTRHMVQARLPLLSFGFSWCILSGSCWVFYFW